jgi:hypothetical protein
MELDKFIRIYTDTDSVMAHEAKKELDKRTVLLHTLLISIMLSLGVGVLFLLSIPLLSLFFIIVMTALTAISIPVIEYLTFLVAKSKSGKDVFWKQLNITNIYLTPIFLVFFIFFAFLSWILPENTSFGLDAIAFFLVVRINHKKIAAVHGIEDTKFASIVYVVGLIVAYLIWIAIFLSPILIVSLLGVG